MLSPAIRHAHRPATRPASSTTALVPLAEPAEPAPLADAAAVLRAVIRRLADDGDVPAGTLRGMAELRHQVETLCTVLRTERALGDDPVDAFSKFLADALESVDDGLVGPR